MVPIQDTEGNVRPKEDSFVCGIAGEHDLGMTKQVKCSLLMLADGCVSLPSFNSSSAVHVVPIQDTASSICGIAGEADLGMTNE